MVVGSVRRQKLRAFHVIGIRSMVDEPPEKIFQGNVGDRFFSSGPPGLWQTAVWRGGVLVGATGH
jgi:hypothetical protein